MLLNKTVTIGKAPSVLLETPTYPLKALVGPEYRGPSYDHFFEPALMRPWIARSLSALHHTAFLHNLRISRTSVLVHAS